MKVLVKVLVLPLLAALALAAAPVSLAERPPKDGPISAVDIFGDGRFSFDRRQVDKANVPTRDAAERLAVAAAAACWYQRISYSRDGWWGSWAIWQSNYWCGTGVSGLITHRSTDQGQWSTGFCSPTAAAHTWAVSGYVGYWHVDLKTQASFNCSLAGIGYNGSPWFVVRYTSWGSVAPYAWDY